MVSHSFEAVGDIFQTETGMWREVPLSATGELGKIVGKCPYSPRIAPTTAIELAHQ